MSRHRDIRNLNLDDYEDPDGWDDRSYSVSPDIPTEYLPPPPEDSQDFFSDYISQAQHEQILRLATEEVRNVLGENFSQEAVERSLRESGYDAQKAIENLLDNPSGAAFEDAQGNRVLGARETEQPSDFGAIVSDEQAAHEVQSVPPGFATQFESLSLVSGTKGRETAFKFDEPSPDDRIAAKQAKAGPNAESKKSVDLQVKRAPDAGKVEVPSPAKKVESVPEKEETLEVAEEKTPGTNDVQESLKNTSVLPKQRDKALREEDISRNDAHQSIVIVGHVDAGKSTLIGQLLTSLTKSSGRSSVRVPNGNLAWLLDEDEVEREKGVTIDVTVRQIRVPNTDRMISLVDSPGHRDFVPMMIVGASMANSAVLVLDSTTGEFEAGFSEEGQTREHAILLRSMGITHLLVACNKIDTMNFSQSRFEEIQGMLSPFLKQAGFKVPENVQYIPCSGLQGDNVVDRITAEHTMASWYSGPSLIEAMDALPQQRTRADRELPTRFSISSSFRNQSVGNAVTGKLMTGTLAVDDKLFALPQREIVTVKRIRVTGQPDDAPAVAGDSNVTLSLAGIESSQLSVGSILCDPEDPCSVVTEFRAHIVVMNVVRPIFQGFRAEAHINGASEASTISRLNKVMTSSSKAAATPRAAKRPRLLTKGQQAEVVISLNRGICMDTFQSIRHMGRFMLRNEGRTAAVGIVAEVEKVEKHLGLD